MAKISAQKISPCLWFDSNAEEAVNFYVSVFKKSKIKHISHYGKAGSEASKMPEGAVMLISFQIEGQDFMALNGGPVFKISEAISFVVNCKNQKEIDYYWDKLSEGGDENAQICGWLKDKFGVSWQIVPDILGKLMTGKNAQGQERAMAELLKMKKIDAEALEKAYKEKI